MHFPFAGFVIKEDIKAETTIKSEGAKRISIVQVVITMIQGNKRGGISLLGEYILQLKISVISFYFGIHSYRRSDLDTSREKIRTGDRNKRRSENAGYRDYNRRAETSRHDRDYRKGYSTNHPRGYRYVEFSHMFGVT